MQLPVRMSVVLSLVGLVGLAGSAHAEPWYRGPRGHQRVLHVSLTVGLGVAFVASESLLKPTLAPDGCRWCEPNTLDARVRNALVWGDTDSARLFSNLTGYVAAPALGIGVTALVALGAEDASWARLIDDTIPILETVAISQAVTQVVKYSVGRQRPFVHYTNPTASTDDNLSFWSGHSTLAFSVVTSAGLLAHWRGASTEPVIWGVGLPLAAATAYLRIAGDKHYFTDVTMGSLIGVAAGLTIPRLMRHHGVVVMPTGTGVSVAGGF